MVYGKRYHLTADYTLVNNVQYYLRQEEIPLENETYTDKVEYDITVPIEDCQRITDGLTQKTEGRLGIEEIDEGYFPLP